MGKKLEKEWIYIYIKLNHLAVHVKLTQHCKSTTVYNKTLKIPNLSFIEIYQ